MLSWDELLSEPGSQDVHELVAFDHPLYVLYSSGTTGRPKAIVHGHGGIICEHAKVLTLHHDLGSRDRFFWFSTTGWMMWNYLVSGLLTGASIVLFDGDPAFPDLLALWRLAAETGITVLGLSAPYLDACRRADLEPGAIDRPAPGPGHRLHRRAAFSGRGHLGRPCHGVRMCRSAPSVVGPMSARPSSDAVRYIR